MSGAGLLRPGEFWGDGLPRTAGGVPYDPGTGGAVESSRAFLSRRSFNASELMRQEFPPVTELVRGMMSVGLVLLVAAPKIGKSWLCLSLAHEAATGGRAFGCIPMHSRPVLYLALEDGPRRLQNRLRRMGIQEPPERLEFVVDLAGQQVTDLVGGWLQGHEGQLPLVILDTLGKVKASASRVTGESDFERDYRIMGALKELTDRCDGSTLLVVHHTRKMGAGDFLDTISGTNGISGAADTIVKIDRRRNSPDGTLQVTSRDAAEGEYAAVFDKDTGLWSLQGGSLAEAADAAREARQTENLGDRMADVIHEVNRHPEGIRPYQVGESLDISAKQASVYLNRAAKADRIANPKRGMFTPAHPVESVASVEHGPDGIQHMQQIQHGIPDPDPREKGVDSVAVLNTGTTGGPAPAASADGLETVPRTAATPAIPDGEAA